MIQCMIMMLISVSNTLIDCVSEYLKKSKTLSAWYSTNIFASKTKNAKKVHNIFINHKKFKPRLQKRMKKYYQMACHCQNLLTLQLDIEFFD